MPSKKHAKRFPSAYPGALAALDLALWYRSEMDEVLRREARISFLEWRALLLIGNAEPEFWKATRASLTRALGLGKQTARHLVGNLLARKLIREVSNFRDGRIAELVLEQEGVLAANRGLRSEIRVIETFASQLSRTSAMKVELAISSFENTLSRYDSERMIEIKSFVNAELKNNQK